MAHDLYQVDAFTSKAFSGNPAAVCFLDRPQPDEWMQNLAAEMNLSETAFLLPEGEGWRLRWFTPATEVDLCGHATLASAYALFESRPELRESPLTFFTRSGTLSARWKAEGVELNFPAMTPQALTVDEAVFRALGFEPIAAVYSGNYFLFEAKDPAQIHQASPDFGLLMDLPMPEVIITADGKDTQHDFVSRFFAPQLGVDEDPVTGSAHCLLTPYWAAKKGKTHFRAFQSSARGGELGLVLSADRVLITGAARMIFKAVLCV